MENSYSVQIISNKKDIERWKPQILDCYTLYSVGFIPNVDYFNKNDIHWLIGFSYSNLIFCCPIIISRKSIKNGYRSPVVKSKETIFLYPCVKTNIMPIKNGHVLDLMTSSLKNIKSFTCLSQSIGKSNGKYINLKTLTAKVKYGTTIENNNGIYTIKYFGKKIASYKGYPCIETIKGKYVRSLIIYNFEKDKNVEIDQIMNLMLRKGIEEGYEIYNVSLVDIIENVKTSGICITKSS